MNALRTGLGNLLAVTLTACQLPDVNLTTRDPLKVDVNVRLDVYQYSKPPDAAAGQPPPAALTVEEVRERQRNRSGEVQTLKNNRLVGENHRGLLTIRELPAGEHGEWVKKVVQGENDDRVFLLVEQARKENLQMHEVQTRAWQLNVERAFPGEWIEVPGEKEGLYKWVQKQP